MNVILTMFFILSLIMIILIMMNYLISLSKKLDREKISPFECGFDPFSSSRLPFSIQFYMISIIFLIFDVEIIIFFPMIPSFLYASIENNLLMSSLFIMILILGLYTEWKNGALKWLK